MERAYVVSVNAGEVGHVGEGRRRHASGIDKRPFDGALRCSRLGLVGDVVVDQQHHGGADQAIYAYSEDDYDWWRAERGLDCRPGLFGENLTIRGLPTDLAVGDRLLIGEVVLEATAPRIPCDTFAAHLGDPNFGLAFRRAERPGIYFRVLNEGDVRAGDAVTIVFDGGNGATILELFRFKYAQRHEPQLLRRFLEAPLAERMRAQVEQALAALGPDSG